MQLIYYFLNIFYLSINGYISIDYMIYSLYKYYELLCTSKTPIIIHWTMYIIKQK